MTPLITPQELAALDDVTILDVRSPVEFAGLAGAPCDPRQGRIPGARNVDVRELVELDPDGVRERLGLAEGAEIAALIRQPPSSDGPERRISLRTTEDDLDVSAIARMSGGGGHRQAAGFPSAASVEEITDLIRREYLAQTAARQ